MEKYLKEGIFFDNYYDKIVEKTLHIYLYVRKDLMNRVLFTSKKIKNNKFELYISNMKDDPKGITILRKENKHLCNIIIVDDNINSLIISLRCVMIKIFFDYYINVGSYPLHCSAVQKGKNTYLFLANSMGGKSSVFFSFASCNDKRYSVLSDDTILCEFSNDKMLGHCMPLKPSMRKGTLEHLSQMEQYRKDFIGENFHIDDQIYIDISRDKNINIVLHGQINSIFFIHFSQDFYIKKIEDYKLIKKQIAMSICGYRSAEIDEKMVKFILQVMRDISFYDIFVPSDMNNFVSMFDSWEETYNINNK